MSLLTIFILASLALIVSLVKKGRRFILLAISTLLVFWLQPRFGLPAITFLVPMATLAITILSWGLTSSENTRDWKKNWLAITIILGITLLVWLNRYFKLDSVLETSTPNVIIFIAVWIAILVSLLIIFKIIRWQRGLLVIASIALILIFTLVKSTVIAGYAHLIVARLIGRVSKYSPFLFQWFGYSYIAFRILHTYFEKRSGRMPEVTLDEYVNYVIFFPALTAGPIDRIERFLGDLRNPKPLNNDGWWMSGKRLVMGLFKKFVIADALALISIDKFDIFVKNPIWLWVLLYLYSFRIFFDFSGYTDIAIGVGRLAGIQLPENFDRPYLKPNITLFWNSWHITLTQWFRSYFFNPLVRKFRQAKRRIPDWLVIFFAQISTMTLIGLWHGFTLNFIIWGAWHGVGLFLHNRWTALMRKRLDKWSTKKALRIGIKVLGVFLTFNFVALGWLFFVIPSPAEAFMILSKMLGIS